MRACVCLTWKQEECFCLLRGERQRTSRGWRSRSMDDWWSASLREREGIEARSQVVGLVFARRRDIASTEKWGKEVRMDVGADKHVEEGGRKLRELLSAGFYFLCEVEGEVICWVGSRVYGEWWGFGRAAGSGGDRREARDLGHTDWLERPAEAETEFGMKGAYFCKHMAFSSRTRQHSFKINKTNSEADQMVVDVRGGPAETPLFWVLGGINNRIYSGNNRFYSSDGHIWVYF